MRLQECTNTYQYIMIYRGKFSVFPYVTVRRHIGRIYYPIGLKLGTHVYTLCEIICIFFGVLCTCSTCTCMHISISTQCGLWRKKSSKSFLTRLLRTDNLYLYWKYSWIAVGNNPFSTLRLLIYRFTKTCTMAIKKTFLISSGNCV